MGRRELPLLAPQGHRGLALGLLPGAEGLPPASISVRGLQHLLLEAPNPPPPLTLSHLLLCHFSHDVRHLRDEHHLKPQKGQEFGAFCRWIKNLSIHSEAIVQPKVSVAAVDGHSAPSVTHPSESPESPAPMTAGTAWKVLRWSWECSKIPFTQRQLSLKTVQNKEAEAP